MATYGRKAAKRHTPILHLSVDQTEATLFFQLASARYEKDSIILTSNKSFGDWGSIFGDTVMATAILDRPMHHSVVVNIRGDSYRLREKKKARVFAAPPLAQVPAGKEATGDNAASLVRLFS